MNRFYKLKVGCRNCQNEFFITVREGKKFGEQNYKLYHRPPLTCPKCGFQENSDYNHNNNNYFFRNFENLGPVVEAQSEETTQKDIDTKDLKEGKEK